MDWNKRYEIFIGIAMNKWSVMDKFAPFYLNHNTDKPNEFWKKSLTECQPNHSGSCSTECKVCYTE